jgi:hypothetical protein
VTAADAPHLSVDDMMDLAVVFTVCIGIVVVLIAIVAVALLYPESASSVLGEFSLEKGTGLCAIFVFIFMVLRLVYKRRAKSGN